MLWWWMQAQNQLPRVASRMNVTARGVRGKEWRSATLGANHTHSHTSKSFHFVNVNFHTKIAIHCHGIVWIAKKNIFNMSCHRHTVMSSTVKPILTAHLLHYIYIFFIFFILMGFWSYVYRTCLRRVVDRARWWKVRETHWAIPWWWQRHVHQNGWASRVAMRVAGVQLQGELHGHHFSRVHVSLTANLRYNIVAGEMWAAFVEEK